MAKKTKWNVNTFFTIIAVYALVIVASWVYFFVMQQFGSHGLVFDIGGQDHVLNIFDIVLLVATIASFFLVAISLLAFKRRKDNRLFVLSIAFFFFSLHVVLHLLNNFFPGEYIFTGNAEKVLELLVILSFIMLLYPRK